MFYLSGFHTVAVDLEHIISSTYDEVVTVLVSPREVSGMIETIDECGLGLLGKIDIPSEEFVSETYLAFTRAFDSVTVFINKMDIYIKCGFTDRSNIVGPVQNGFKNRITRLTH